MPRIAAPRSAPHLSTSRRIVLPRGAVLRGASQCGVAQGNATPRKCHENFTVGQCEATQLSEGTVNMADNQRPRFRVSIETRTIYDRIVKMVVGETLTYRELSDLIGDDVRADGRSALNSARRMAQRDNQIVTDAVVNVGLKRMSDVEIVGSSGSTLGEVRRAARRGIDRITAVTDFEALPAEIKIRHNAAVSALGVIAALSRPKEVRKLEAAVNTSRTGQLPIGRTLEMLRRPAVVDDETKSA